MNFVRQQNVKGLECYYNLVDQMSTSVLPLITRESFVRTDPLFQAHEHNF